MSSNTGQNSEQLAAPRSEDGRGTGTFAAPKPETNQDGTNTLPPSRVTSHPTEYRCNSGNLATSQSEADQDGTTTLEPSRVTSHPTVNDPTALLRSPKEADVGMCSAGLKLSESGNVIGSASVDDSEELESKSPGIMAKRLGLLMNSGVSQGFLEPTTSKEKVIPPEILAEACDIVRPVIQDNPNALGVVLLAHHRDVHESIAYNPSLSKEQNKGRLRPLDGIETGTSQLEEVLTNSGLAVVRLQNPTKMLLRAVMKVMSSPSPSTISYPKSYRYFFFYTTGHGANRVFFTKDGSISYNEVYKQFQGLFVQRYFFFDCCRSMRLDTLSLYPDKKRVVPDVPEFSVDTNNRVIYATVSGLKAWGPGGGVSHMTKKMVALLKEYSSMNIEALKERTMDTVISRLQQDIWKETFDPKIGKGQQVLDVNATGDSISPFVERHQAMVPRHKGHQISRDGATAEVTASFPPPVTNSQFHRRDKCHVEIETQSGDWTKLPKYHRSDSHLYPLNNNSASCDNDWSASFESDGPPSLSADSPPLDQKTFCVKLPLSQDAHSVQLRVVSHLAGGLSLSSDAIRVTLPKAVRPVISGRKIYILQGFQPRVTISWNLLQPLSIPVSKFTVHIYRQGIEEPVHSTTVPFVPNKEHYESSYAIPELMGHSEGDGYEVIVTAGRVDGEIVPSSRVLMETTSAKPHLDDRPRISSDGAVAHVSVTMPPPPSETLTVENLQFQMKASSGEWEDLHVYDVQSNIPISPRYRTRSRTFECDSGTPLRETASFHTNYGTIPRSLGNDSRPQPSSPSGEQFTKSVILPVVNRPAEVELRLLARYSGGVEVKSNVIACRLRPLAKPDGVSANITHGLCHNPEATVTWNVQRYPAIRIIRFSVALYTKGSCELTYVKDVNAEENRQQYQCSVRLTDHSDGDQYDVIVTAVRGDGEEIPSIRKSVEFMKGCCSSHCRPVCTCTCKSICAALLLIVLSIAMALLISNSLNMTDLPFNVTLAPHSAPFEVPRTAHISPSFSTALITPDYSQQMVRRAPDRERKEAVDVYCAEFEKPQLSNSQRSEYLGPSYTIRQTNRVHNLTLNNSTRCLPLPVFDEYLCSDPYASYMLPKSNFSVAACLKSTSTIPSVELRLYRSVNANNRWSQDSEYILTRANLSFNESGCSNTTLAVPQGAIVFAALSSHDDVQFKSIYAYVTIVFYSLEALDLDKKSNLLDSATGKFKLIPSSGDFKLVCYVAGELLENTVPNLISGLVPSTWVKWALPVGILVVVVFSCLVCVILGCVCVCVCKSLGSRVKYHYVPL